MKQNCGNCRNCHKLLSKDWHVCMETKRYVSFIDMEYTQCEKWERKYDKKNGKEKSYLHA